MQKTIQFNYTCLDFPSETSCAMKYTDEPDELRFTNNCELDDKIRCVGSYASDVSGPFLTRPAPIGS